jgi:tetratricopeptide (TPR) repeat protein
VTAPAQWSARAALDAARPAVARLDVNRGTEDLAADLIETWSAVEAALRSLVGSSVLAGQPLIREARQRQLISFDQANSLAEFEAVHSRVQDTSYRPNLGDVNAARDAFLKLDTALMGDSGIAPPRAVPAAGTPAPVIASETPPHAAATTVVTTARRRRMPPSASIVAAVIVLVILIGGGYLLFGRRTSSALQEGIAAYTAGQREAAVNAFNRAERENPNAPMPHVYLARMAREVGNFPLAGQELQLALQADPNNEIALREMGSNLLAQGNYDLARRFYVRAVQADASDKTAMGYLGCTLMKLNRAQEASPFLTRAGAGPWSNCTPAPNGALPPAPGMLNSTPTPAPTGR